MGERADVVVRYYNVFKYVIYAVERPKKPPPPVYIL